jgi:hypothetical protein
VASSDGRAALRGRLELAVLALAGVAATLAMVWYRAWQVSLNDYSTEARMPLTALLHGHIWTFLRAAPSYGPSLELRAPFALLGSLAGGSPLLIYRLSALPCLLALAGLAVWIAPRLRSAGRGWIVVLVMLAVCVANPINYYALAIGHPEEALGAVLCVAAVIVAVRGQSIWAGLLLGVAIANKEWAVVAIGPVLLALPEKRWRALLTAGATTLLLLGPIALASSSVKAASGRITVNDGGSTFYPEQIWWFFGTPGRWLPSMAGQLLHGYRWPPSWLQGRAHLLIAWVGLPLSWLAYRRGMPRQNVLALLALLLLLRCILDPWDLVYYPLPFIVALLTWETTVKHRAPIGAVAATLATWAIFEYLPNHLSANQLALSFIVPSLLALAAMSRIVYRRPPSEGSQMPCEQAAQSTTRSSFGNWLSRRQPSGVSTVRSSIRTPSSPGK